MKPDLLALLLALVACSDSHESPGPGPGSDAASPDAPGPHDGGPAPDASRPDAPPTCEEGCRELVSDGCCGSAETPSTCTGGRPSCPPRWELESRCAAVFPMCTVDWASCDRPSDCVVRPASCCGSCGAATPSDMDGVNVNRTSAHMLEVCGDGPVGCPGCFMEQDPRLIATCAPGSGQCRALDLSAMPEITACARDEECVVRYARCCACTNDAPVIAIRRTPEAELALQSLLCDPMMACDDCIPPITGFAAVCRMGSCEAARAM